MPRKNSLTIFFIVIFGLFILLVPQKIVWGGFSWQTVPTVGPSLTASVTPSSTTMVTVTATRTGTTAAINPSSTATDQAEGTLPQISTSTPLEATASAVVTGELALTASLQTATSTSTISTSTPVIAVTITNTPEGGFIEPAPTGPPFWLLPLSCSVGLVVLILVIRLLIRRRVSRA